jgi:uncharacterized glyoxalase superfamily protein PhnB
VAAGQSFGERPRFAVLRYTRRFLGHALQRGRCSARTWAGSFRSGSLRVVVEVNDVDKFARRAVEAGARVDMPVEEARQRGARDCTT